MKISPYFGLLLLGLLFVLSCDDNPVIPIDECGGDNSTCLGCDDVPNSGIVLDECGECGGDNSTCLGCDDIPNSGLVNDECEVCNGENYFNEEGLLLDGSCDCDGNILDECGVCDGDGLNNYGGCGDEDNRVLIISCSNCTVDSQGTFYYEYVDNNYGQIDFYISNVNTYTLVSWTSPQEFCVYHMGIEFCDPVINYSTYSDENGYGHQNFFIDETFIGSTLQLIGHVTQDIYDEIFITIH